MDKILGKKGTEVKEFKVYESIVILSPTLNDDGNKDIFNKVCKFINDNNGEIIESTFIGLKKLAYKIKNFENGCYLYFRFKLSPSVIDNLRILYSRDEGIIRDLIVNLNKEGNEYNENRKLKKGDIITMLKTN